MVGTSTGAHSAQAPGLQAHTRSHTSDPGRHVEREDWKIGRRRRPV